MVPGWVTLGADLGARMGVARCWSWFQDGCFLVWSWCQSGVLGLGAKLGASHKKNASVLSSCFPKTSLDVFPLYYTSLLSAFFLSSISLQYVFHLSSIYIFFCLPVIFAPSSLCLCSVFLLPSLSTAISRAGGFGLYRLSSNYSNADMENVMSAMSAARVKF